MCRYRIKLELSVGIACCAFIASACGLVDLRTVIVTIEPGEAYAVLDSRDAPIMVGFSAPPARLEAERAFSIKSPAGSVEGDFSWSDDGFSWRPVKPWDPGVRYRLMMSSSIPTEDGRVARVEADFPFFAVRSSSPPVVVSFYPADGASVGVSGNGTAAISLRFSEPMDGRAVREALSLSPSTDFLLSWNADMTEVALMPTEPLAPCALYDWTLSSGASAVDGSPIPAALRSSFWTDLDAEAPRVERTYPVVFESGVWVEAAADLACVDSGQSLALRFSEAVDPRSIRAAIRVEPSVQGVIDVVASDLVVFTPERGWEPEEPLTLVVSGAEDLSGLTMMREYRERFTPAVRFLRVLELESGSGETASDPDFSQVMEVSVGDAPDGVFSLAIRFSEAFGPAAKSSALESISLLVFFPASLSSPELRSASWPSDDTLLCTWEGLRRSGDGTENYYLLTVAGGEGGIASDSGAYLADDVIAHLKAKAP